MSLKGAGNGLLSSLTVYELLLRGAEVEPNSPAITYIEDADTLSTVRLTRGQFITRLHQMIRLFRELGVERSDVISILSPNIPDAMVAFYAAETVGIVNPINFLLRPEEIVAMVQAVKAKVLITIGPEATDLWKTVEYIKAHAPLLEQVVTIGRAAGEAISFLSAVKSCSAEAPSASELPTADDIAAYFHTGGTTGSPKIALHTHRNQVFSAEALANSWEFDSKTRVLNGLPIFHVAGSLLLGLSPLGHGGEVILPTYTGFRNPRVIANYWRIIDGLKVTVGGGIPTTLVSLLDTPVGDADIKSLKFLMTGGTYMPPAIGTALKEKLGIETRQLYGMTETAGLIAASHHSSAVDPNSIGEVIEGAEVEVREFGSDGNLGQAVVKGKAGVLVTRGPNVFPGYLSIPEQPFTKDGWLITGDIGLCGSNGRIVVTGRAKDVIIRSGHNIDPAVIEEAAGKHAGVGIAAAVGMPDAYAGEIPVVYLTLASDSNVSPADLMAHLTDNVPEPPARPRYIFIIDEMPTTAVGKIDKTALRRDATRRAVQAALAPLPLLEGEEAEVRVREGEGGRLMVTILTSHKRHEFEAQKEVIAKTLERYGFAHEVVSL